MSKRRSGALRAFFFVLLCMFISIGLLVGGAWYSYAKTQQRDANEMRVVALTQQNVAKQNAIATYPSELAQHPSTRVSFPPTRAQFAPTPAQSLPNQTSDFGQQRNASPNFQPPSIPRSPLTWRPTVAANPFDSFVAAIKNAEDDDSREEAIDQAKTALEKHYDNYIDNYEKQVNEMEDRVAKLREQLDKRKDAKDRLVEMKLESITNQADGFGWPDEVDPPNEIGVATGLSNFQPQRRSSNSFSSRPSVFGHRNKVPTTQSIPVRTAANSGGFVPTPGDSASFAPPSLGINKSPGINRIPSAFEPSSYMTFEYYFDQGIRLLEGKKYEEFLDQFMEREKFLKAISTHSLGQVATAFEKGDAESILEMLRAAKKDPTKYVKFEAKTLIWDLNIDGEIVSLKLVGPDKSNRYYLELEPPVVVE
jgi:hypothetical protein